MRYRFLTADVFTDRVFGGNPLAVLPDARGIGEADMQKVAREFNLSETVFVLPAVEAGHTRRLRIFTPARELPFAGHPTVGAALVLAWLGEIELRDGGAEIVLEEGAGPVPVTLRARDGRAEFAELAAPRPPEIGTAPEVADLAALLGLNPSDLRCDAGLPAICSSGVPFLIVELEDAAALARVRLDRALWQRLEAGGAVGACVITRDAADAGADFRVRTFAPDAGIEEDPATGAAAAALGGWLGAREIVADGRHRHVVAQGLEMGRPSRIEVEVERREGGLAAVRVGGGAVPVAEGTIEVPGAG